MSVNLCTYYIVYVNGMGMKCCPMYDKRKRNTIIS
eukprot:UN11717